jgi:mono/diheme cytochrome c family protein
MLRIVYRIFAVVGLLAVAALVLGVVAVRQSGLSARDEPGALEARLARFVRGVAIPDAVRGRANPVPSTPETMAEARAHFADHCASCHGNDGSGLTALGRRLYPRAPDMRLPATQSMIDGELFHLIENGIRFTGMPAWGGEVSPEVSWKLVLFIRHLPRVGPEEILEMERLNPKSPAEWREFQQDQEFLHGSPAGPSKDSHHAH